MQPEPPLSSPTRIRTGIRVLAGIAVILLGVRAHQATAAQAKVGVIRALLVIGGCCHDYGRQKDLLTRGIAERAPVEWTVAYDPDTSTKHLNPIYENADWARGFEVVVHDECSADVKELSAIDRILKPHREGLPAVLLHCSMHCYRSEGYPAAVTPWFEFTGLQTTGHGPQLPIAVSVTDRDSAITRGMADWSTVNEELYNNPTGRLLDTGRALMRGKQNIKAAGTERVEDAIVAWTNMYRRRTRVFATTLGHNNDTVGDPRYLDLVARGLLWSTGRLK